MKAISWLLPPKFIAYSTVCRMCYYINYDMWKSEGEGQKMGDLVTEVLNGNLRRWQPAQRAFFLLDYSDE